MFTQATRGKNIVNTTSTASGKTLGFLLPVVQEILSNPQSRAIFLYPTKALASDQYRAIRPWIDTFGEHRLSAGVYDGDTPPTERSRISCQCVPPPFQNLQILSRITQVPLQFRYHSKPRGTCPGSVPDRRNVEVILKETRDMLDGEGISGTGPADRISGYRGGYTISGNQGFLPAADRQGRKERQGIFQLSDPG